MMKLFIGLMLRNVLTFAKVTGPLLSISARGSVAKTLTYSVWKGTAYVKEWFTPSNPQSATQTNVRTAWDMLVLSWQNQHISVKTIWNTYAEGSGMSGFNQFMSRGMGEYIVQITSAVTPVSVVVDGGTPPAEVWTWT